jgi:hypothetical protein
MIRSTHFTDQKWDLLDHLNVRNVYRGIQYETARLSAEGLISYCSLRIEGFFP